MLGGSRILACLVFFATALVLLTLQTVAFPRSATPYGGRLVEEMVPHQPELIFASPSLDQEPIYLDHCAEFFPSDQVDSSVDVIPSGETDRPPPGVRKGLFQKLFFSGVYLPRLEADSLGINDWEAGIVLGVPFFRVTAPLLITPRFAVHLLDGPTAPDLPSRVYDAEINFRHFRKFGESPWSMMAAVTLGQYSDFESSDSDAFRVTGQAFAIYQASPTTQWIAGVVYLNREDIALVPALGAIYQPSDDLKVEAILPRPKISWRLIDDRWAYVGGEFGGGIWSINRPLTGQQDLLTYNDFRLLLGVERKAPLGELSHRLEIGYVFGRELQFSSSTPDTRLDDSLFVRVGATY